MNVGKFIVTTACIFMCASLAYPQSLVELAQKEKARRARMKKHAAVLVTNRDLKKSGGQSAVRVVSSPPIPRADTRKQSESVPVRLAPNSKPLVNKAESSPSKPAAALKQAEERVGELTLKLGSLWKAFYTTGDRSPRHLIQQQISLTFLELQKAQQEVDDLKDQREKVRADQPEKAGGKKKGRD